MSARRGTANTSSTRPCNIKALANITKSNIELIDKENFLEYFDALADELARQADIAGEPFLAYLASLSALEAKSRRDEIRARWQKSAA